MEYILYCDESSSNGKLYSDFFGGCLVSSRDLNNIVSALEEKKNELNLYGEIKWTKVTSNYLEKYKEMMDLFFSFVKEGKLKIRIMFRRASDMPSDLSTVNNDNKYFKLYYQFIKHAFGFMDMPQYEEDVYLRIYLDQLPDKKEKCDRFKDYVRDIPNISDYKNMKANLIIREGDIAEVKSHEHILLQCTDIVLGAMFFRLNQWECPSNRVNGIIL